MSDATNGQAPSESPVDPNSIEKVKSAHIVGVANHSISTDGQAGMVVLLIGKGEGEQPEKFALTFPATHARVLANIFHELSRSAAKMGTNQDMPQIHFFNTYDIAYPTPQPGMPPLRMPDGQGITAITFDRGAPQEYTIGVGNVDVLKFARMLERDVKPRMGEHERQMWLMVEQDIKSGRGLLVPGQPGFPGKFNLPPLPPGSS